jgi:hypothetical protein
MGGERNYNRRAHPVVSSAFEGERQLSLESSLTTLLSFLQK